MVEELQTGKIDLHAKRLTWHINNVERLKVKPPIIAPKDMVQVVMIATYNETREVVEPTIQSVLDSEFDMKQVILVLAYEQRGGPEIEAQSNDLVAKYKGKFMHAMAVKHPPDIPREIRGKGGNITYAGRELQKWLEKKHIDPLNVIVTTLDADNRPHPKYLAALSYVYAVYPDPEHISVQPISVYNNNIWDAPAPMRVIATGNTFFNIVLSLRPHMLRNFSAHAQGMKALIQTNFWSVRTIVEDGHQFWRSYFAFDGNYRVLPLYVPIYQDAVLAQGYIRTLKAQFVQLRRWTYGASDIAFVVTKGLFSKNKVPRFDLYTKIWRLIEGHVTWAVGPIISLTAGFIPSLITDDNIAAVTLPTIVSRVQTIALIGLSASLFVCFKTLPPKPARYKHHRSLFMVLQWVYLPITTIVYNSFAALYSQTRLMFGKYLDKFDVTEKATVMESGQTVSRHTKDK
jgi:cellulose synthase/poly-beta-1,6-N-acetylglucosamine synthase-like glycosyltransferase